MNNHNKLKLAAVPAVKELTCLADDLLRERYTVTSEQELREHARALKDYATFRYDYLRKTVLETTDWIADRATILSIKQGRRYPVVGGWLRYDIGNHAGINPEW